MPKSSTCASGGGSRRINSRTTSTPKASSPKKMLPSPAMRMRIVLFPLPQGFHFICAVEKAMPGLAQHSKIPPRIVLHHERQVDFILRVLLDGFDDGDPPGKRHVHRVGAALWTDANAVAGLERRGFRLAHEAVHL